MEHVRHAKAIRNLCVLLILVMGVALLYPAQAAAASKPKKPPQVKSVKIVSKTTSSVKLKWKKSKNTKGYQIYRATAKNAKYKRIKTIKKAKSVTYTNKKLKSGKKYYYKVRAYNKKGKRTVYGKFSKKVGVTTKKQTAAPPKAKNAAVSLSYKGKTITLGSSFNPAVLGNADLVVKRGVRTVYVYEENDFRSYLELNMGTSGTWNGKVVGWYTNQPQIAVVDGKSIKHGMSNAQVQAILKSSTRTASYYNGAMKFSMDHAGSLQINKEAVDATMYCCAPRTQEADIKAGEVRLRYAEKGYTPDLSREDKLVEYRTNSIRSVTGYQTLSYAQVLYQVGNYSSSDYAKSGTITPRGEDHVTSDGLTMDDRFKKFGIYGGECAFGIYDQEVARHNGLAALIIDGYFNSSAHHMVLMQNSFDYRYAASCTIKGANGYYANTVSLAHDLIPRVD